jgi:hypothetical protein
MWSVRRTASTNWMRKPSKRWPEVSSRGSVPPTIRAGEENEDARKVLRAYLKSDGTLKQIPTDTRKLLVILNFIVDAFPFDATFTEKEVNTILRRFHVDTAALRRYLVDNGFMNRESDGSKYWRVKKEVLS